MDKFVVATVAMIAVKNAKIAFECVCACDGEDRCIFGNVRYRMAIWYNILYSKSNGNGCAGS